MLSPKEGFPVLLPVFWLNSKSLFFTLSLNVFLSCQLVQGNIFTRISNSKTNFSQLLAHLCLRDYFVSYGASLVAQTIICLQWGRPGFDPWVRKIPCRKEWQPTPVFLPGEFHGQRSLVGYNQWGRKESDTTEQLSLSLFTLLFPTHIHSNDNFQEKFWMWQAQQMKNICLCWSSFFGGSICMLIL